MVSEQTYLLNRVQYGTEILRITAADTILQTMAFCFEVIKKDKSLRIQGILLYL